MSLRREFGDRVINSILHDKTIKRSQDICTWFNGRAAQLKIPIYSSYDIRDAGFKVSNVDANIYPAGFNNICPTDKETSINLMADYLKLHYGSNVHKVAIVTEQHTNNPYYWENVLAIKRIIELGNKQVRLCFPRKLSEPLHLQSATGSPVEVFSGSREDLEANFAPDLIISNNDFSESYEEWAQTIQYPINPPRELGWYQRKKSRYFRLYNQLVDEFSKIAEIDSFLMRVETDLVENFEIEDEQSRQKLASKVDEMIERLRGIYKERNIRQEPFVFVKNNAGTYGLAVIKVNSGDEVRKWNYKSRKKMKAAKGGREVNDVIVQEGIPSVVQYEGSSAEPVIYMIGSALAGGFLRTHSEKNSEESLNSPGAVYKRLCVSDLAIKPEGCPQENVYGWTAKLGLLAIALEAQEMGINFLNYSAG